MLGFCTHPGYTCSNGHRLPVAGVKTLINSIHYPKQLRDGVRAKAGSGRGLDQESAALLQGLPHGWGRSLGWIDLSMPPGNLYGVASAGGSAGIGTYCQEDAESGCGIVFELTPTASRWDETILHNFNGAPDGSYPLGGLIFDAAGNLFGTTGNGGRYGGILSGGTLFEVTP
jgi:hypothetical protein